MQLHSHSLSSSSSSSSSSFSSSDENTSNTSPHHHHHQRANSVDSATISTISAVFPTTAIHLPLLSCSPGIEFPKSEAPLCMRIPRASAPPKFVAPNHTDLKAEQFLGGLIGMVSEAHHQEPLPPPTSPPSPPLPPATPPTTSLHQHHHHDYSAVTLGGPTEDFPLLLRPTPYNSQNITYVHALLFDSDPCIPFEIHTVDFYSEVFCHAHHSIHTHSQSLGFVRTIFH
jgi:hypothetical protein